MTDRKKILIVDDQYGIRILLGEIFGNENYMTFLAANGVQALEIMEKEKPNLILLDMKIPGMDGIEILRKMKEKSLNIDVIMMTAYGELKVINEAKELGALTYIAKPFDIDFVREEVDKYIQSNMEATDI